MRFVGYDEDWARCFSNDFFRHASKQHVSNCTSPVFAHDEQVDRVVFCVSNDLLDSSGFPVGSRLRDVSSLTLRNRRCLDSTERMKVANKLLGQLCSIANGLVGVLAKIGGDQNLVKGDHLLLR